MGLAWGSHGPALVAPALTSKQPPRWVQPRARAHCGPLAGNTHLAAGTCQQRRLAQHALCVCIYVRVCACVYTLPVKMYKFFFFGKTFQCANRCTSPSVESSTVDMFGSALDRFLSKLFGVCESRPMFSSLQNTYQVPLQFKGSVFGQIRDSIMSVLVFSTGLTVQQLCWCVQLRGVGRCCDTGLSLV